MKKKEQSIEKQIQQLIKDECANYFFKCDNKSNYCCQEWTKDLQCIYFQTELEQQRCGYFESAVLPIDGVLMAKYHSWLDIDIKDYVKNVCLKCKVIFLDIKKKDYCTDLCAEKAKKEKGKSEG